MTKKMVDQLLDEIDRQSRHNGYPARRLDITRAQWKQLRTELQPTLGFGTTLDLYTPITEGFVGYLFGVPMYLVGPEPLIEAVQRLVDSEGELDG